MNCLKVNSWSFLVDRCISQKAVVAANKREAVESVAGAGAGSELWGSAHRAGNHFSGKLWVNMLHVSWAPLKEGSAKVYLGKTERCGAANQPIRIDC